MIQSKSYFVKNNVFSTKNQTDQIELSKIVKNFGIYHYEKAEIFYQDRTKLIIKIGHHKIACSRNFLKSF